MVFFFFSSRRRHTRWTGDWSSDVCSSDLGPTARREMDCEHQRNENPDARSEERRVGKSVDLGGRRIIKKKKKKTKKKKDKKKKRKKNKKENKQIQQQK